MTGLLSPVHVVLVAAIVLLVFGGRRLPQLGRLTGTAIRTRLLGKPPAAGLPGPTEPGPGSHPPAPAVRDVRSPAVRGVQPPAVRGARSPAVRDVVAAQARQHALRTVLRRLPGPVGWIVRLLVR